MRSKDTENKRKAEILRCIQWKGWSWTEFDKRLGISRASRYRKMQNIGDFKISEIAKIIEGVPLTEEQVETLIGKVTWNK